MNSSLLDPILIGLGEILWDMLPTGKQLGGAPANFAYHAQALGGRGMVVSCVGEDDLGREILARLNFLNLDNKHIAIDRKHPTGTVTVDLDARGVPSYTIHESVAWDYIRPSDGMMSLAQQANAVCFGSLCQRSEVSRHTIRQFLGATGKDCVRIFDINLRQQYYSKEIIDSLLELCDVLKLNDEELPVVADILGITGEETAILGQLVQRYNLRLIALTRGFAGSRLFSEKSDHSHSGLEVQVADTVGAGDSFAAVVALGLLQGDTLEYINERANRIASFVCTQNGATPPLTDELVLRD
jgi:fructokinase